MPENFRLSAEVSNARRVIRMAQEPHRIFISWIGITDTNNIFKEGEEEKGPLLSTIEHFEKEFFHEVILFHTDDPATAVERNAIRMAVKHYTKNCRLVPFASLVPADPSAVYEAESSYLASHLPPKAPLYYGLTSGSPAMYAVQVLMCASKFPGIPLYTTAPKYRKEGAPAVSRFTLPDLLPYLDTPPSKETYFIPSANKKIYEQVRTKVAQTNVPVLIMGETGVGKTELAKYIHACSLRRGKPMISLNCAEIAGNHSMMRSELFGHKKGSFTGADKDKAGKFVEADGSTLFLDEVGEIPLDLQGNLLTALDSGSIQPIGGTAQKVNVRIVAATNRDLMQDVKAGRFRLDLYYRLALYAPKLAPVREYSYADRKKLLEHLLEEVNRDNFSTCPRTFSDDALALLLENPWHGNIREMKFRLTSICLLAGSVVTKDDVLQQLNIATNSEEDESFLPDNLNEWVDERKKLFARRALARCGNKDAAAAQLLGMNPSTFRSMRQKYQI